jgi:hypothetical protein
MLEELREKYKNHEYMKQKVEDYITHFPELMQSLEDEYNKKQQKKQQLLQKIEEFISLFLSKYCFLYIPQTEIFVEYTDKYKIVHEDVILQLICSLLDKSLLLSKSKIIPILFRRIKENILIQSTNTCVAKMVRDSLPFSKEVSTYFLTILGDVIIGKKDLIYYIDVSYKPFLKSLHQSFCLLLHKPLDVFKHKYYDHIYDSCRVIPGICSKEHSFQPLELMIASVTYSTRYGNSDGYLIQNKMDDIFILKQNTPESLITYFLSLYTTPEGNMSYKDVYFLWKTFLRSKYLPFVISQQNFKLILQQQGICEGDYCKLTTMLQTNLLKFKHFWDTYMVADEEYSYELLEIIDIFQKLEKTTITLEAIKEVLLLEYPLITIEGNTILYHKCLLWNKNVDIDMAMNICTQEDKFSFYEQYIITNHKKAVNKDYFEKYILNKFIEHS